MLLIYYLRVHGEWFVPEGERESVWTERDVADTLVKVGAEVDRSGPRLVDGESVVVEEHSLVHRTCVIMDTLVVLAYLLT